MPSFETTYERPAPGKETTCTGYGTEPISLYWRLCRGAIVVVVVASVEEVVSGEAVVVVAWVLGDSMAGVEVETVGATSRAELQAARTSARRKYRNTTR